MSIITISRGSYSKGKEIAEKVALELNYECIARKVLLEAKEEFNVPEIKLIRAIHDAPSILSRLSYGKEKYISFIQAEILNHFKKDNVVYHGLAGHFFVKGISHVLKVRIIADMEDRVRLEMEREGIPRDKALHILQKDDPSIAHRTRRPRSLAHVASKWTPEGLVGFLLNPTEFWPASRMGSFKLSDQEALDLASYLFEKTRGQWPDQVGEWSRLWLVRARGSGDPVCPQDVDQR